MSQYDEREFGKTARAKPTVPLYSSTIKIKSLKKNTCRKCGAVWNRENKCEGNINIIEQSMKEVSHQLILLMMKIKMKTLKMLMFLC